MAAVNEEITGDTASAVFTPTEKVSDVIIEGQGGGKVRLQALTPSGNWRNISEQIGHFAVITSDLAITYRFQPTDVTGNVRVYMGP